MSLITISPGHYLPGSGTHDLIDEVTEARKVVNRVVQLLRVASVGVNQVVDNYSTSHAQNLDYIISHHNKTSRKLDVSIHFNATSGRHDTGIGTEVLYQSDKLRNFANKVSQSISNASSLRNRGGKKRINIPFLNNTDHSSILIEICFVNSTVDVAIYKEKFEEICIAIANELIQFVKPGHPMIKKIPETTSQEVNEFVEESSAHELKSVLDKTIPTSNFTEPSLITDLEDILTNPETIKRMIEKGISEKIIEELWLEKLDSGVLTTIELLGISTLIIAKTLEIK
ncbi:N-acetylmuramoyl-L-alanine amidase [Ureibacillus manganicus]|uniref:N-acetylmuramoyl-L-alanine amidase n=1 Tax=Ureibacillus manganicus TaxID=1266064 RepID=UPI00068B0FF8|nr:N-acetylmuramoyl-L-alanine amidase [Ureibacillus manganicus]